MDNYIYLTTDRCVLNDGYLWFVNIAGDMICKTSVKTWLTEVVVRIPDKYRTYESFTYDCAAVYKNRVILFPKFEDWILDYDTDSEKFFAVEMKCPELDYNSMNGNKVKFRNAYVHDDKLFLMPHSCHRIVEYDLNLRTKNEHIGWYEKHFASFNWKDINLFCASLVYDNRMWFLCRETNAIMEFEIDSEKTKLYYVASGKSLFSAFAILDNGLFAIFDYINKKMIYWDVKSGNEDRQPEIDLNDVLAENEYLSYITIFAGKKTVLLPFLGKEIIIIGSGKEGVVSFDYKEKGENEAYISRIRVSNNKTLFISQRGVENLLYDDDNDTWSSVSFKIKNENLPMDFSKYALLNEQEGRSFLKEFIKYVDNNS